MAENPNFSSLVDLGYTDLLVIELDYDVDNLMILDVDNLVKYVVILVVNNLVILVVKYVVILVVNNLVILVVEDKSVMLEYIRLLLKQGIRNPLISSYNFV